ncbi:MAG: hypothetical protein AVDCRST_MAG19-2935 [uncultured Thermomicrobiales bacterium]|uniref:Uncharacterized protein n=1 Tax=uncultured Thermomicrobiales bacterium TaxID=1645740 RepID=A0A6J4VFT5_9BACT|nr:MAG: hypothetical protein AVDCRST_MAG19-2935 [uncultured Thermomicrobiales bacterium]
MRRRAGLAPPAPTVSSHRRRPPTAHEAVGGIEEPVRHVGTVLPHPLPSERVPGAADVDDTHHPKVFGRRLRQTLGDNAEHPRSIRTA